MSISMSMLMLPFTIQPPSLLYTSYTPSKPCYFYLFYSFHFRSPDKGHRFQLTDGMENIGSVVVPMGDGFLIFNYYRKKSKKVLKGREGEKRERGREREDDVGHYKA